MIVSEAVVLRGMVPLSVALIMRLYEGTVSLSSSSLTIIYPSSEISNVLEG